MRELIMCQKTDEKKPKKCNTCGGYPENVINGYCSECGMPGLEEPVWDEIDEEDMTKLIFSE